MHLEGFGIGDIVTPADVQTDRFASPHLRRQGCVLGRNGRSGEQLIEQPGPQEIEVFLALPVTIQIHRLADLQDLRVEGKPRSFTYDR
jgi:hypothetical protein